MARTRRATFSGFISSSRSASSPTWKSRRHTSSACLCSSAERPRLKGGSNQNQRSTGRSIRILMSQIRNWSWNTRPSKPSRISRRIVERAPSAASTQSALSS